MITNEELYEAELAQALEKLEVVKTTPGGDIVYEIAAAAAKVMLREKFGIKE